RLRKEAGYEYTDRIELSVSGAPEIVAAVRAQKPLILGETLTRHLVENGELPDADIKELVDIDGRQALIALKRWVDAKPKKAAVKKAGAKKKTPAKKKPAA